MSAQHGQHGEASTATTNVQHDSIFQIATDLYLAQLAKLQKLKCMFDSSSVSTGLPWPHGAPPPPVIDVEEREKKSGHMGVAVEGQTTTVELFRFTYRRARTIGSQSGDERRARA